MISRMDLLRVAAAGALLTGCDMRAQPDAAMADDSSFEAAVDVLPACRVEEAGVDLPDEVRESSGLARSARDPRTLWTHNDAGNDPVVFAIGSDGRLVGPTVVRGARLEDWEDIAAGPCAGGSCLFIGDIGDNDGERETITIYEVPEPEPGAATTAPARALRARFPDGPRDAEALFALPSGDLYVVTKGREGPIALYRLPAPHRPGEVATLERVRELAPEPAGEQDRVTGATASPDGRWVGIRSYRTLRLYPAAALVGGGVISPVEVDLRPLSESQGESLTLGDDGSIWLSSEAAGDDGRAQLGRLSCTLDAAGG